MLKTEQIFLLKLKLKPNLLVRNELPTDMTDNLVS